MFQNQHVVLIIPVLDEEETIGPLLARVDRTLVDSIVIVDNGSTDRTADIAKAAGAIVLREERRGYGSACLKAVREGPPGDIVVFMDGDGSDDPSEIASLLNALAERDADMVIGSRVLGGAEPGALTPLQRFGSTLTCFLVRHLWGVHFTDLGPFRAIRRPALDRIQMSDPDFGWTIEMQVKAAQQRLRTTEIPVRRAVRQAGTSKISGTLVGSYLAGTRILGYVFDAWLMERRRALLALTAVSLAAACVAIARIPAFDPWVWTVALAAVVCGGLVVTCMVAWERAAPSRMVLATILLLAVVFRLALLGSGHQLSDDAARYHWDGKVLAHGINPYLHAPTDPQLAPLRVDAIDAGINHPELHTVYPPLAELLFAVAYQFSPGRLTGFHLLTLVAEMLTAALLMFALARRGMPGARVLLLAWLPLLLFDGWLPGHVDLLGLPFVALFILAVQGGHAMRAGLFLGLASLIKPLPLLFLPAAFLELRAAKGIRMTATTLAVMAVFYRPFLDAGHWLTDSMWRMAKHWTFNGSLADLAALVLPPEPARALLAPLLAILVALATWRGCGFLNRCLLVFTAFVVCTPTLYPWYLVWMLPLLVLRPDPALLALAVLAPLTHVVLVTSRVTAVWSPPLWVTLLEYVPFYALLLAGALRGRGMFARGAAS